MTQFHAWPSPRHLPGCVLHFPKVCPPSGGGGALNKVLYARTREGFAPRTNRLTFYTVADPGGGSGGPHLPYQTLHLFETEILTSKGLYITF